MTWSSQLLPKIVTTGVSAATSSRRFGSASGRFARWRVEPKAASFARSQRIALRGREELDVLRVRARPAALDVGHAVLVEHAGDAELVGQAEDDVLALGAVAEGGVVEDDGRRGGGRRGVGSASGDAAERASRRGRDVEARVGRVVAAAVATSATAVRRPPRHSRSGPRSRRPSPTVPTRVQASAAAGSRGQRSAVRKPSSSARADGRLHRVGGVGAAQRPAQEHRRGEDRPHRVRQVLPGDVRRGAVDRLVEPVQAVRRPPRPDRGRGQHPQAPRQHRRLVGEDVAEEVLRDEHVEATPAPARSAWRRRPRAGRRGPRRGTRRRSRGRPSARGARSRGRWPCRRS